MTGRWRILPTLLLLWSSGVNALDAVDTAQSEAMIDLLERCRQGVEWLAAIYIDLLSNAWRMRERNTPVSRPSS